MAASDDKILERLRVLLAESDLQTTTEKMLRKKLEEEFQMDMLDKKQMIRKEIESYLAEQGGDDDVEEAEEADERPTKKGSKLGCILSEPLQKFLGVETLPRTEVVKRLWDYIKANNLQDPKDKRKIMLDAKLKTIFTSPMTMFSMNAQLSKHCFTDDGDVVSRSRSNAGSEKRPAAEEKSKPAKKPKGDGEAKQSSINKPVTLSKEMASWVGQAAMARSEVTSFFWKYVKEKNLQDSKDKRMIVCDATLKKLTGEDSFPGFSVAKYLAKHFIKD